MVKMVFVPFSWQSKSHSISKTNGNELSVVAKRIAIITGELSGENHAAHLVNNINDLYPVEFSALGSTTLAGLGVEVFYDYHNISLVGFEILSKIGQIWKAYQVLKKHLTQKRPDLIILVDFPGFNLGLVSRLTKKLGIPTVYFIPPQIWAWRMSRVTQIKDRIDLVFCIFPFEENIYTSHGVPVVYIGHPYVQSVKPTYSRDDFFKHAGIDGRTRLITLMPGSRTGEVKRHLPVLMEVLKNLDMQIGDYTVLLPVAESVTETLLTPFLKERKNIILVKGLAHDCLSYCDGALIKSGSTTLEAAILGTPSIVFYKMSWFSYRIGRALAKVPYVSLPNIIANKAIFPEFIQHLDPAMIAKTLSNVLENGASNVKKDLDQVRIKLTTSGHDPYRTAAEHILRLLEHTHGSLLKTT
jgi:lipid-A-disaccharide synthase